MVDKQSVLSNQRGLKLAFLVSGICLILFIVVAFTFNFRETLWNIVYPKLPLVAQMTGQGDINEDGVVDVFDLGIFGSNYGKTGIGPNSTVFEQRSDLNESGEIDVFDLGLFASVYGTTYSLTPTVTTNPSPTNTPTPSPTPGISVTPTLTPTPTPDNSATCGDQQCTGTETCSTCTSDCGSCTGTLSQSVCDPNNGPFTNSNIDNPWFPLPIGLVNTLEGGGEKVQFSVLDQTELVAGVTTRVIEEREWVNNQLAEVSCNFFIQAENGTVCYYGEDVYTSFDGNGNPTGGTSSGTWRVGHNGARAGIMMPPDPQVGMNWLIEDAAASGAYENAIVNPFESSYTTPAGTFNNILHIIEDGGASEKRYAQGVGMIFDDGIKLTSSQNQTPSHTCP
jgi:hypothetical protein